MIGCRKHGHNEVDEPGFTQPEMYEKIRNMKSLPEQYAEKLVRDQVIDQKEVDDIIQQIQGHFENEYEKSKTHVPTMKNTTNPKYKGSRAFTHKWDGIVLS